MTGYELRLWRKGEGWDQERAAEELGVCLRSYKNHEKKATINRTIELATQSLSLKSLYPELQNLDVHQVLHRLAIQLLI